MASKQSSETNTPTYNSTGSSPPEAVFATKYGYEVAVMILVIVTRLPLLGNFLGEPDTARYAFGLRFWMATRQSGSIINADLSAGYYWLAAHLANALHVPYAHFPLLLNTLSFVATFLLAFSLFELGAALIGRRASMVATVLVLMSPSVWWAGIQGHPQILGGAAILSSMLTFVWVGRATTRGQRAVRYTASTILFATALLMKSDFFLYALAYPPLYAATDMKKDAVDIQGWFRYCRLAAIPIFCGYFVYVLLKKAIFQGASVSSSRVAIDHVLRWVRAPRGIDVMVGQLTPALFSHGFVALLFAAAGTLFWIRSEKRTERRTWLLLLATWTLPQYLFWVVVIYGNNARHLLLAPLPLFWLAANYLCRQKGRLVAVVVSMVLVLDFCIPPNSGSSLYPSPNVPASVRLMRRKENDLRRMAHLLMSGEADQACYFGLYTIDHVSAYLLEEVDISGMLERLLTDEAFRIEVRRADGTLFRKVDVLFARELPAQPPCGIVESVEYRDRMPIRYFGSEWTDRPLSSLLRSAKRPGR